MDSFFEKLNFIEKVGSNFGKKRYNIKASEIADKCLVVFKIMKLITDK